MRLTHDQIQAIKQTAHAVLGNDSRVILFGSRSDATKKGGDIDLLFETVHAVGNRATTIGARQTTLFAAQEACNMPFAVIEKAEAELHRLGVPKTGPFV